MEIAIREVILKSWPPLVVSLSLIIIMRLTLFFKGEEKSHMVIHEEIFGLFFITYLLILFQLVSSQDISALNSTNLMPFREILRYDFGTDGFNRQVIGNILLFIPFGYFVSCYCKVKNLGLITIVSAISSLVIESVQHFIGRSFDVDDIILNVVGSILGFLLFISLNAIRNHLPKFLRKDWFLNLLSLCVLALTVWYIIRIV